jgi:hypothetical protein
MPKKKLRVVLRSLPSQCGVNGVASPEGSKASSTASIKMLGKGSKAELLTGSKSGPNGQYKKKQSLSAPGGVVFPLTVTNWTTNGSMWYASPNFTLKAAALSSKAKVSHGSIKKGVSAAGDSSTAIKADAPTQIASSNRSLSIANIRSRLMPGEAELITLSNGATEIGASEMSGTYCCNIRVVSAAGAIVQEYDLANTEGSKDFDVSLFEHELPFNPSDRLLVSSEGYLSKFFPISALAPGSVLPVELTLGDLNGDNVINQADVALLQRFLGMNEQQFNFAQLDVDIDEKFAPFYIYDIVRDGIINTADVAALSTRFGTGDTPTSILPLFAKSLQPR